MPLAPHSGVCHATQQQLLLPCTPRNRQQTVSTAAQVLSAYATATLQQQNSRHSRRQGCIVRLHAPDKVSAPHAWVVDMQPFFERLNISVM
jgi:hypothetical protein